MLDDPEKPQLGNGRSPIAVFSGVILIGLALALLIFGSDLLSQNNDDGSLLPQIPAEDSTANTFQTNKPLQVGDSIRDFVLNDTDGNPVHLTDFNGQPVILNFWATWCGPCRIEMPDLQAAFNKHQADGLVILALNRGESAEMVRAYFYDDMDLTFTPLLDRDGDAARLYNVANYPTSIFINRDGTVTAVHLGIMVQEQIEGYLAEILKS